MGWLQAHSLSFVTFDRVDSVTKIDFTEGEQRPPEIARLAYFCLALRRWLERKRNETATAATPAEYCMWWNTFSHAAEPICPS